MDIITIFICTWRMYFLPRCASADAFRSRVSSNKRIDRSYTDAFCCSNVLHWCGFGGCDVETFLRDNMGIAPSWSSSVRFHNAVLMRNSNYNNIIKNDFDDQMMWWLFYLKLITLNSHMYMYLYPTPQPMHFSNPSTFPDEYLHRTSPSFGSDTFSPFLFSPCISMTALFLFELKALRSFPFLLLKIDRPFDLLSFRLLSFWLPFV